MALVRSIQQTVRTTGVRAAQQVRALGNGLPPVYNEPVWDYVKGVDDDNRANIREACQVVRNETVDIPCVINGEEIYSGNTVDQLAPSQHELTIARIHHADEAMIKRAIDGAVEARKEWELMPWEHRAAVFLRAADMLTTEYRFRALATTMIGQGKNVYQAEIDAAAEAADFFRFGVHYANEILHQQPEHHAAHVWNRLTYRALEGFVAAVPPFNFTAIGANLGACPAIMGNSVLWKPTETAALSNFTIFQILREAGIPDGVIQFVPSYGPTFGDTVAADPRLAAINFTGSTKTFDHLTQLVASRVSTYNTYPRLIGECGGKNFHWLHESADVEDTVNGTIRSAFEYQGQKCSACSRVYVPRSLWPEYKAGMIEALKELRVGQPDEFSSFMTAVIDEKSFDKISGYIEHARQSDDYEILFGGECDKSTGYFIQPTMIQTTDPKSRLMQEEIFGPVVTAYVYEDEDWESCLQTVNETSPYGLTGAVYARDRSVIDTSLRVLHHAAGNIYINAKSTGSVVGQQPFGGARRSGTNDKAGAANYLLRFTSIQSAKECLYRLPDWRYEYMED